MINEFGLWLQQEREKRKLTQSELARIAHLNRAVINKIENNQSSPAPETLTALAHALKLPPELVFRRAGLLPSVSPAAEYQEELLFLLHQLPPAQQKEVLDYLRFKADKNEEPVIPAHLLLKPS